MKTYNLAEISKKIYQSKLYLFTTKTLLDLCEVKKLSSAFKVLSRLQKENIIEKIERNKYKLADTDIDSFSLANFLYQPSYVSFESALNFYGILSQFPYDITSATPKISRKKTYNNTVYSYSQIKKELFFGYEKNNNRLIALPEKALLDQIYLASKGYKSLNLEEYDFSCLKKARLKKYLRLFPLTKQFGAGLNLLKSYYDYS